jgi:aminoglycoside phosphotransferase (APT) family kinase protein
VKLFHPRWAFSAEMELARARAVHALGAPCPGPFERVEHEGRTGIVYERIDGPLLLDSLRDGSASSAQVAGRLAGLHARLHAVRIPPASTLPRLRDSIRRWLARLTDDVRERGERELERLPDEEGLCHGDLHPGNVIVCGARLVVVDWVNASAGPLALDVARSYVLLAWQGAKRRDGGRQAARLELAACYREAMAPHVAPADFERALGFAADALLRAEPANPFAAELQTAVPWR